MVYRIPVDMTGSEWRHDKRGRSLRIKQTAKAKIPELTTNAEVKEALIGGGARDWRQLLTLQEKVLRPPSERRRTGATNEDIHSNIKQAFRLPEGTAYELLQAIRDAVLEGGVLKPGPSLMRSLTAEYAETPYAYRRYDDTDYSDSDYGGRESVYDVYTPAELGVKMGNNPRRNRRFARGPRGGYSKAERASLQERMFLKPETRSWPVSDLRHAEIALQYMARGFGNRSEYGMLLHRLFTMYPPDQFPQLAEMYERLRGKIEEKAGGRMARANTARMEARENWVNFAIQLAMAALPYLISAFKKISAKKLAQYQKLVASGDVKGQIKFLRRHAMISPPIRLALTNDKAAEILRVKFNEALADGGAEKALAAADAAADVGGAVAAAKMGGASKAQLKQIATTQAMQKIAAQNPRQRPGLYMLFTPYGALPQGHKGFEEVHSLEEEPEYHRARAPWIMGARINWPKSARYLLHVWHRQIGAPEDVLFYGVRRDGKQIELSLEDMERLAAMDAKSARRGMSARNNPGWQKESRYWPSGYDGTDPKLNAAIIQKWLRNAPSDWKSNFREGMSERAATGQGSSRSMTLDNALKILGITAGGNRSDDAPLGRNRVPDDVRAAAMKGLALSWTHDYGGWNFIGVARAMQLAVMPGVPRETLNRMGNFFGRNQKWKNAKNFGNDGDPSRGYMAWLNWGGVEAEEWLAGKR